MAEPQCGGFSQERGTFGHAGTRQPPTPAEGAATRRPLDTETAAQTQALGASWCPNLLQVERLPQGETRWGVPGVEGAAVPHTGWQRLRGSSLDAGGDCCVLLYRAAVPGFPAGTQQKQTHTAQGHSARHSTSRPALLFPPSRHAAPAPRAHIGLGWGSEGRSPPGSAPAPASDSCEVASLVTGAAALLGATRAAARPVLYTRA